MAKRAARKPSSRPQPAGPARAKRVERADGSARAKRAERAEAPERAQGAERPAAPAAAVEMTRERLVELLNEDLEREYQAVIAYVVYSQVIKGAQYMNIAKELEVHATEELAHALTLSRLIDYLGGMPAVTPKPVKVSDKAEDMLRFDLDNENVTIEHYRRRVDQCRALGLHAMVEDIREILRQEQDHQIALATALGKDVPDVAAPQQQA